MPKLVAIVLALWLAPGAAGAVGGAQEVADGCRELLKPNPRQTFEAGLCVGGFTTLYALSGVVDQNQAPILGFCRPPTVQYLDLVRVFVRHVETHPQVAQGFYAIEAVNALIDAYPCRRKP